jgi:hypothetical protein
MLKVKRSFLKIHNQHYKETKMKKFLIALNIVIWSFVGYQTAHAAEPAKKPAAKTAPAKKEVKKHKKFDGEKVPEKAPAPAKKPAAKK